MKSGALDCNYSIEGSGPAIFLTHGVGAAEDAWRFVKPKLSEKFFFFFLYRFFFLEYSLFIQNSFPQTLVI